MSQNPLPDGRSSIQVGSITTPAAGADFTTTIPPSEYRHIIGVSCIFTTDANAANRNLSLIMAQTGVDLLTFPSATNLIANTAYTIFWTAGHSHDIGLVGNRLVIPIPDQLFVPASFELDSLTDNIQAGDAYTQILYLYESWKQTFG